MLTSYYSKIIKFKYTHSLQDGKEQNKEKMLYFQCNACTVRLVTNYRENKSGIFLRLQKTLCFSKAFHVN